MFWAQHGDHLHSLAKTKHPRHYYIERERERGGCKVSEFVEMGFTRSSMYSHDVCVCVVVDVDSNTWTRWKEWREKVLIGEGEEGLGRGMGVCDRDRKILQMDGW